MSVLLTYSSFGYAGDYLQFTYAQKLHIDSLKGQDACPVPGATNVKPNRFKERIHYPMLGELSGVNRFSKYSHREKVNCDRCFLYHDTRPLHHKS